MKQPESNTNSDQAVHKNVATSSDNSGTFTAFLQTMGDYVPQALSSTITEINRITSENVRDIELRLAKSSAVGKQSLSGTSYREQARLLLSLAAHDRPLDWRTEQLELVLNLTADDLREAAEKYFSPGQWFVSIAGGIEE